MIRSRSDCRACRFCPWALQPNIEGFGWGLLEGRGVGGGASWGAERVCVVVSAGRQTKNELRRFVDHDRYPYNPVRDLPHFVDYLLHEHQQLQR
jgi:hypothetical protein